MRNSRQGKLPIELEWLVDALDDIQARLKTVESPSGEALSSTVAKLQSLVADIQAQLDAWASGRWTNAQITAQITALINSTFAGSISVGGTITSPVTFSTDVGGLPGSRRAMWMHDSGLFGWASSSRERKTEIRPADFDVDAIIGIEPKRFRYLEAIRRYDELPEDEREGREPRVEVGFIAEDLDDAGLDDFVVYDKDGRVEGVEYSMLVVAQQAAIRDLAARIERLESGQ